MRPNLSILTKPRSSDHAIAVVARVFMGTAAIIAGLMIIRSIPDLVRYVKMERM